jgi:GNAT superfamily N-acetyltransferase
MSATTESADDEAHQLTAPELPSEWHSWATRAIEFRLVDRASQLDSTLRSNVGCATFGAVYTHQAFDNELLVGYKRPRVLLSFVADSLFAFAHMSFAERNAVGPHSNVARKLKDLEPPGAPIEFDRPAFVKRHQLALDVKLRDEWRPPGTLLDQYAVGERRFEVYWGATAADADLRAFVARASLFLTFFIEVASYVRLEEDWIAFLLFERLSPTRVAFVGFLTLFRWQLLPPAVRWRISQVLVLPPFQRQGHGPALLRAVYRAAAQADSHVLDITVEDASDDFTRMRDAVDLELLMRGGLLPLPAEATAQPPRTRLAGEPCTLVDLALVKQTCAAARQRFHLCDVQTRRLIRATRYLAAANPEQAPVADLAPDASNPLSLSLRERWCASRHWSTFGEALARVKALQVPIVTQIVMENEASDGLQAIINSWAAEAAEFEKLRRTFDRVRRSLQA